MVLALTVLALTRSAGETAAHARGRAFCLLSVLALAEASLTRSIAWSTLLTVATYVGFWIPRRARYLALLSILPGTSVAFVVVLAFAGVPLARRLVERHAAEQEIRRGTLVYVDRWGFVDRTHAHPGPYREALAAIERGERRVRLSVELIDARLGIHVVERTYAWSPGTDAPWALAAAMTLDIERAAERVQASAPWHLGFAISAYAPHDLPSNLFGVMRATGRLAPRAMERDRAATLARYRMLGDSERHARVMGYFMPSSATAREHADFRSIQRAARSLVKGPVRTYLHPISR